MSSLIQDEMEIEQKVVCSKCHKTTCKIEKSRNELYLNLQPGSNHLSIQSLLNENFHFEELDLTCSNCNHKTNHNVKKWIKSFPETLIVVLGRYSAQKRNHIEKLQNSVYVNPFLSFPIHDKDVIYNLKSAVCHFGQSPNAGHYSAVVKSSDQSYICCSDTSISQVNERILLNTAYIVIYDRAEYELPHYFPGLLNCYIHTDCLKYLMKLEKFTFMPTAKQSLIQELSSGISEYVTQKVKFDLNSQLHKFFERHNKNIDLIEFYKMFLNYLFDKKRLHKQ